MLQSVKVPFNILTATITCRSAEDFAVMLAYFENGVGNLASSMMS